MRFYLDVCERNVLEIAHEYFIDSETIPLVPEENSHIEQDSSEPKPTQKLPKIQHTRIINYKKLYDAWNEKAFTSTTLEEFTAAIDNANFSKMMEQAENAGQRAGYIGAVKFIIKRLSQHLGSNWYDIACVSIGEDQDSVNKLNDGTKQIKKINVKILSTCIT